MAEPSYIKLYAGYDTGTISSGWQVYEYPSNNAAAMSITTDRARVGTKSNKITLRSSDSPAQYGNTRTEFTYNNSTNPNTSLRWYAWSWYMPSATYAFDSKEEVVAQWHDKSSSCSTSPPFAIQTKSGRYRAYIMYAQSDYCTSSNRKGPFFYDLGPILYDQWVDVVVYYDPKTDGTGRAQIWMNGTSVFNYTGPCHYQGSYFPYFKIGLYKWFWDGSGTTDSTIRTFYIDEIRVGDTGANLDYFFTALGATPPASTTTTTSTTTSTTSTTTTNPPPSVSINSASAATVAGLTTTLTATVSDNGTIASYLWEQVSGSSASIATASAASTSVTLSAAGVYVFRLTVTDNAGASSSDTVTVTATALYSITKV